MRRRLLTASWTTCGKMVSTQLAARIVIGGRATEICHWHAGRNAAVLAGLCLTFAMTLGCSHQTAGAPRAPKELPQANWVEWVTDPESSSQEPRFIRVLLRGDGDFAVGSDFPSGSYESSGGRGGLTCRWYRLATKPDGSLRVLQSGGGPGFQRVQIGTGDFIFRSSTCQPWTKLP